MNRKLILGALVILAAATVASARNYSLDERADVDLSGVSEVVFDLRGPSCAMCVRTMDILSEVSGDGRGGDMVLTLTGDISSNKANAVPSLIIEEGGRKVTFRFYPDRKTWFGLNQGGRAVFAAVLPESYNGTVSISGASDDIVVRDFTLENLEARSSSGNLDAENIRAGEISLDLSSGDLRGDRLLAADILKVESSSGRLDLGDLEGRDIRIEASSGEITIANAAAADSLEVKASSGRINITSLTAAEALLDSSSGRISVDTAETGAITFDVSSGDILVGTLVSGIVNAGLSSGDLSIDSLTADRTEVTSTGDTTIREMTGELRLNGSSGRVDVTFAAIEAPMDLDVSSGDITITAPAGSAFDVDIHTSSGRVRSDFPILGDLSSEGRGMQGSVNGGGVLLKAETSSGDVRLQAR